MSPRSQIRRRGLRARARGRQADRNQHHVVTAGYRLVKGRRYDVGVVFPEDNSIAPGMRLRLGSIVAGARDPKVEA